MQQPVSPFRFKSFNGELDREELREQELARALAEAQAQSLAQDTKPMIDEEELERVRQEAFERGRQEGYRDGLATLDRDQAARTEGLRSAAEKLESRLSELGQARADFLSNQREILCQLALSVARKVAGRALQSDPIAEIEAMIQACLTQLSGEQQVTVFLHPAMVSYMQAVYAEKAVHRPKDALRVQFQPDVELAQLDDCRLSWTSGMMERRQDDIWAQLERMIAVFDPLTATTEPKTEE